MIAIHTGDLAYISASTGTSGFVLVPCKVLEYVSGDQYDTAVRVTADRLGYKRGEIVWARHQNVLPRGVKIWPSSSGHFCSQPVQHFRGADLIHS